MTLAKAIKLAELYQDGVYEAIPVAALTHRELREKLLTRRPLFIGLPAKK